MFSLMMDSSSFPPDIQGSVALVARLPLSAETLQLLTWRKQKKNTCSFSNISLHRNLLFLFVKHLSMLALTGMYRMWQH
jgi:hypothetical protein